VGRGLWGGAAMALIASGCAGAGATAAGERCASDDRSVQLRAQVRRDRHTIRNLENEVTLLRAQLRERPAGWRGGEPPPGPAPAEPTAQAHGPDPTAGEPLPQDVAEALYGDVEIVYEGEAARQTTVRPRIELHESSRVAQGLTTGEGEAPPPAAIPDVGAERLPVQRGRIPTVEEQLRRARTAAPTASRPAAAPGRAAGAPAPAARPALKLAAPAAKPADKDAVRTAPASAVARSAVKPAAIAAKPAAPAVTPAAVDPAANPVAEYKRYMAALKKGNHDYAVAGLRSFLGRFPDHYLSDNVQYHVAESYFARKLYSVALAEYQKVIDRHWGGNKLPDAMLRVGMCQLAVGNADAGRAALRRLVGRFPRTKPAKIAKAKLKKLGRR
jgi:tol-pal system protein YbgF